MFYLEMTHNLLCSNIIKYHTLYTHKDIILYICVCCVCDWEMLDVFDGFTEVTIYVYSMILLQIVVVLTFLIPGLTMAG